MAVPPLSPPSSWNYLVACPGPHAAMSATWELCQHATLCTGICRILNNCRLYSCDLTKKQSIKPQPLTQGTEPDESKTYLALLFSLSVVQSFILKMLKGIFGQSNMQWHSLLCMPWIFGPIHPCSSLRPSPNSSPSQASN